MSVREKIRKRIAHLKKQGEEAIKNNNQEIALDSLIRIKECEYILKLL